MWNGTMFVDLDWPLNASSLLSASAELLVNLILEAVMRLALQNHSLEEIRGQRLWRNNKQLEICRWHRLDSRHRRASTATHHRCTQLKSDFYAALLPRRGPHIASHSVCPSVCPSVRLSVRPVIITERHVAPPSELQWHTCTFQHAQRAAYRMAISAAQTC